MSPIERAFNKFTKGKKKSSYISLCDDLNEAMIIFCDLMTSFHSTKISSGNKLEDFIYDEYTGLKYENIKINDVLDKIKENSNITIVFKKVKISKSILENNSTYKFKRGKNLHLDFLVYSNGELFINELKDGYSLDTKKSNDEINEIKMVKEVFEKLTNMKCYASLILWTCEDLKDASIKSDEADDYIVSGRDFASKLSVNFHDIEKKRMTYNKGNVEFIENKMLVMSELINEKRKEN